MSPISSIHCLLDFFIPIEKSANILIVLSWKYPSFSLWMLLRISPGFQFSAIWPLCACVCFVLYLFCLGFTELLKFMCPSSVFKNSHPLFLQNIGHFLFLLLLGCQSYVYILNLLTCSMCLLQFSHYFPPPTPCTSV